MDQAADEMIRREGLPALQSALESFEPNGDREDENHDVFELKPDGTLPKIKVTLKQVLEFY